MKSLKVYFVLLTILAAYILPSISSSQPVLQEEEQEEDQEDIISSNYETTQESSSLDGSNGRILAQKKSKTSTRQLTCNKYPRICHTKGSPGPYCCKKKCVNVLTDRLNCGWCGNKCRYNEICCNGKCVNPSFSKRHCGGCNNRCNNGGFCAFGLCNYA